MAHRRPIQPQTSIADLAHLKSMRDEHPVWRDDASGNWNVYRYEHVAAVLADARTFSSDFASVYPESADMTEGSIIAMDPPRHDKLRGLVTQAFTPRAVARLEPRIREIATELLDQIDGRSRLELVSDFSYPLPVTVIAELLGVPAADRTQFKKWADALLDRDQKIDPSDKAARETTRQQLRNFRDYLQGHVAARRVRLTEDLISDLVKAEIDGQRLEDGEIVGFATILLLAGHITTTLLLGNTLRCLDEFPTVQSALRADPNMIPTAVEEALRYRSPVPMTARVTTCEVQIGGQVIPPRQLLSVWLLSANHDERQFADPDTFIPDRHPNPHLAFGKGIHFCIGAPLARLESRVALDVLLKRFADIRVDARKPLEPYSRFNGTRALHLEVKAA